MRLPKLAIENHQFTNVFVLLLVLMGTFAFITMPRYEDPLISPSGSSIIVIYPGANPVDIEELIIDPLEEALNELEDIKVMSSSSEDGIGVIGIEFEFGSDADKKYSDVVQKVNGIRSQLPQDILSLETVQWSISDVNIYQFALISETTSYNQLESEADRLQKSLQRIPLIKRAEIMAYPEQEIRISIDLEKIAQYKIPLSQITQLVQAANQNIPGGHIDIGAKRFNIQTSGPYNSITEIGETIIHAGGGKYLRLKDIADIAPDYADDAYYARFDGKRCLFITLSQKEGTNIFDVSKQVDEKVAQFKEQLGSDIQIKPVFDQSASVASRLNGFFTNLLQGLILVGIVILLAVGFRASIVVLLAIPLSITIGIGFVDLTGYGLQQMTIAGLVIALGLLVDNAIVVTENISRFIKKGFSRKEAAIQGTSQIAWAVVSSTATTVLAFIPMMAIQNITGDFIRSMPTTVIYTLSASLLISLILTPNLASKLLKSTTKVEENFFRRKLDKFIEKRYRSVLSFSLKRPAFVFTLVTVVFVASLLLFPLVGVSFFPKAEKPQFVININTPKGTNLNETDRAVTYVESVLKQQEQVAHYASNIGHGNPRIYYNIIPLRERSTHAQIFVLLDEYRPKQFRLMVDKLRRELNNYAGADIDIKELEQGPLVDAPIAIRLLGENLTILERISRDVERMISSTDGTLNLNNPFSTTKMDLHVSIDRIKAGMLGVPLVEIDRTVRAAVAGMPISTYRDSEGKEYNIVVRLPFKNKMTLGDLDRIWVTSAIGTQIPLSQLANMEFKKSPIIINHYNLERDATVTADVFADYSVNDVTEKIINELEHYPWPKGYRYSIGGEIESQEESFGGMAKAILVAVIGIFAVLVLQFRSYKQPLIVFSAIPLAIIGSIIALLLTGNSFSFTAFVGITSLVGIVVNNSIILVDYTNQLVQEGKDVLSAIKEAGETRFVPIILTTLTTVGGLLPLTLIGGTLWAPMGWTIIGGLLVSTFLTLIVVPVLYKIFTKTA